MSGYAFDPEAFTDIDQLWEHIAEYNINAADRIVAAIRQASTEAEAVLFEPRFLSVSHFFFSR